ncbi:MAG: hypothetical protein K2P57_10280 [Burkholderiales bacterium]|nr:hypothetical protein [Burkholderiales bacterium]
MKLRRFLLFFALLSFLGVYSLEAMHRHVGEADEMACAVCHVAAHSSADTPSAALSAPLVSLVLLYLVSFAQIQPFFKRASLRPRSRSPPR